jgi:hypothetical protein
VTRKRSGAKPAPRRAAAPGFGPAASETRPAPKPDAPITGVASGSLGTAANLDDTQVMRTADLERAAAESAVPAWLTDDAPPLPDEQDAWDDEAAVEPAPVTRAVPAREHVQPPERVRPRSPVKPRPRGGSNRGGRLTSALAGAVAGALLVLVAGAALLGAMGAFGTNPATGGPPFADATETPAAMPTAEPTKAPKDCHGKGKGNDCKD